jgi:hypothetical protein
MDGVEDKLVNARKNASGYLAVGVGTWIAAGGGYG